MPCPWGSAPHTRRSFLEKAPPKTKLQKSLSPPSGDRVRFRSSKRRHWPRRLRRQKKRLGEKKMPFFEGLLALRATSGAFWKKLHQKLKMGRTKFRDRSPLGAFFFEAKGTKKKALQKRNAVSVGLCAPHPHHLLKKVDENLKGASRGGGRKL